MDDAELTLKNLEFEKLSGNVLKNEYYVNENQTQKIKKVYFYN